LPSAINQGQPRNHEKVLGITHFGAETCVTGSCHLVQVQPDHGGVSTAILVDCGIVQGHDPQLPFDRLPVPPADIDFLFLTHAQIDHIGRTQELIYELDRINPGVPVFIDSPLGIRITRLYQDIDRCWDREAKALKAAGDHPIQAGTPGSACFLLLTKHFSPVMSNKIEHKR
jgi:Cft2 family RNA processing exonuclease